MSERCLSDPASDLPQERDSIPDIEEEIFCNYEDKHWRSFICMVAMASVLDAPAWPYFPQPGR